MAAGHYFMRQSQQITRQYKWTTLKIWQETGIVPLDGTGT